MTHQSHPIISNDSPEGFIESPMWVGTGTRLQARKLPANGDQEIVISSKFETLRGKISEWQNIIEFDLITVDIIKAIELISIEELNTSVHKLLDLQKVSS